jgi:hypothetical protein
MWMKPVLSGIQKTTLVVLALAAIYANKHVRSDGFVSSQGFPLVFRHFGDAGPFVFSEQLFLTDAAIAAGVLLALLLTLASKNGNASRAQTVSLMAFSALYYWMNVDVWHGWPMGWLWKGQIYTYGFPLTYAGQAGTMHLGSDWAIIPDIIIGVVGYLAIDRAFTKLRGS